MSVASLLNRNPVDDAACDTVPKSAVPHVLLSLTPRDETIFVQPFISGDVVRFHVPRLRHEPPRHPDFDRARHFPPPNRRRNTPTVPSSTRIVITRTSPKIDSRTM